MTITHHLDDATLMSFAAGSLPSALSALAAAHIAGCPRCRRELRMLERIGGALVSALSPATLDRSQPAMPEITSLPAPAPAAAGELPAPLVPTHRREPRRSSLALDRTGPVASPSGDLRRREFATHQGRARRQRAGAHAWRQ